MLMRIVFGLGVLLVLVAGGAAGWEYMKKMQPAAEMAEADAGDAPDTAEMAGAETAPAPAKSKAPVIAKTEPDRKAATPGQKWLYAVSGGYVSKATARKFLRQAEFTGGRELDLIVTVPLADLLEPGESLPPKEFERAFAVVRAAKVGAEVCTMMQSEFAEGCVMRSAELSKAGYNPKTQTAEFRLEFLFTAKADALPMPDLEKVALQKTEFAAENDDLPRAAHASAKALLAEAFHRTAAEISTAATARNQLCRPLEMLVIWRGADRVSTEATIACLQPMG